MKGDFSRIRFSKKREQEKNYRKVLFQQGRVLTDADWNDQIDIQEYQDTRYFKRHNRKKWSSFRTKRKLI